MTIDTFDFNSQIEPFPVADYQLYDSGLPPLEIDMLQREGILSVGNTFHHNLFIDIMGFLR